MWSVLVFRVINSSNGWYVCHPHVRLSRLSLAGFILSFGLGRPSARMGSNLKVNNNQVQLLIFVRVPNSGADEITIIHFPNSGRRNSKTDNKIEPAMECPELGHKNWWTTYYTPKYEHVSCTKKWDIKQANELRNESWHETEISDLFLPDFVPPNSEGKKHM